MISKTQRDKEIMKVAAQMNAVYATCSVGQLWTNNIDLAKWAAKKYNGNFFDMTKEESFLHDYLVEFE